MKRDDHDDGTIRTVLDALKHDDAGTLTTTELFDKPTDGIALGTDLIGDVPAKPGDPEPRPVRLPYAQMTNSTWRILEEQRMSALEIARECADAIHVLEAKRDDALRTADMCVAGQKLGEFGDGKAASLL